MQMEPRRLFRYALILVALLAAGAARAEAQCVSVDPNFAADINRLGIVSDLLVQPDGKILISGDFTSAGGATRRGVARLNPDGSLDTSFVNAGVSADVSASVSALALQPDGRVVIVGSFTSVGGVARDRVARLNANGTLDLTFPDLGVSIGASAVAVQPDGKILIGGPFTTVAGVTRRGLARLNPDGSLDAAFNPNVLDNGVNAILIQPDGRILIGGGFTSAGGATRRGVARLNPDGTADASFADPDVNLFVSSLALQPDGKLLIGGFITSVGGATRRGVARLNPDGSLDTSFVDPNVSDADPFTTETVFDLALQPDGRVVIAGSFTSVGGSPRIGAARLGADGSLDPVDFNLKGTAGALALLPDGRILIGGSFASAGGAARLSLARFDPNGTLDASFDPGVGPGVTGLVLALGPQPDGKVVIGGLFDSVGAHSRRNVARLNADGSPDASFADLNLNGQVEAIALQPDGKILIGGGFTSVGGATREHVARLNPDGSLDTSFVNPDIDGLVLALALQPDGKILAVGNIFTVAGATRRNVARLNPDGSLDASFVDPDVDQTVSDIALQPDGKILVGGSFDSVGGATRRGVARLNPDGSLDTSFVDPDVDNSRFVDTLALQPDGKVVIGGNFLTVGGAARRGVARLNTDGTLDNSFADPDVSHPTSFLVDALAVQPDGRILIGGRFHSVGGAARRGVARLNADGSLDDSFADPDVDSTREVDALELLPDGRILIGGNFSSVGGLRRLAVARLQPAPSFSFSQSAHTAGEGAGSVTITVLRSDAAGDAAVDYAAGGGTASDRSDFTPAFGTLRFAAGESSKTFTILITDDALVEGDETVNLSLSNPAGGLCLSAPSATLTITDNDAAPDAPNPIDSSQFFVRQHYLDFLGREPDAAGLQFWTNNIESCGADAPCREVKRVDTSAAFFLSIEFQETGFFVIRARRVAFGSKSVEASTRLSFKQFLGEARQIGEGVVVGQGDWEQELEQNKLAYLSAIIADPAFVGRFPVTLTAAQFVDALYDSASVTPTPDERAAAIAAFGAGGDAGRRAALKAVLESASVRAAEFNAAFVLMQYFGYLRRNPTDPPDTDDGGYQFWLQKLEDNGGDFRRAEMVRAFILSLEYRGRFGNP